MNKFKLILGFVAVLVMAGGATAQAGQSALMAVIEEVPDGGLTISMLALGLVCLGLANKKFKQ